MSSGPPSPVRIDQVIPAIVEHDAVSNHTFAAQRLLRSLGYASDVFARIIGPGCAGRVRPLEELEVTDPDRHWLCYQHSIGSPAAEVFARHPGRKLLDYHNVTPAHLVERWLPPLADEARLGRAQLRELAPIVDFAFADSPYNAAELEAAGFAIARVVPVLVEPGNVAAPADPQVRARLAARRAEGGSDWLFVGQLAPHKAQHDVVAAFACYREVYDERARLHLVGREMGSAYRDALERFVAALGLEDAVDLPGSVPTAALAAYYEAADVFVCCSDHEGFCAPLVEAMARGLPVVAFAAAAVPGTLGDAGVLLERKDPAHVAAAARRVLTDPGLRAALVQRGRARAALFSRDRAEAAFAAAIAEAVTLVTSRDGDSLQPQA
ncbi:MAG TPA: glycosyltransferase [Acidimicrobiales bacterium]|nr:glycosyltransferase [Acidimicrobiales bacterium]